MSGFGGDELMIGGFSRKGKGKGKDVYVGPAYLHGFWDICLRIWSCFLTWSCVLIKRTSNSMALNTIAQSYTLSSVHNLVITRKPPFSNHPLLLLLLEYTAFTNTYSKRPPICVFPFYSYVSNSFTPCLRFPLPQIAILSFLFFYLRRNQTGTLRKNHSSSIFRYDSRVSIQ